MPTISEQLAQLQQDREDLVDNLETMGISGLSGDETFTELVPEVLNISGGGGADLSDYFKDTLPPGTTFCPGIGSMLKTIPSTTTAKNTNLSLAFAYSKIEEIPSIDTSNVTNMESFADNCKELITVKQIDTSKVTNFSNAFRYTQNLVNFPVLNMGSATNLQNMFSSFGYYSMSDTSLDNVLQSLITATSYTGTKTLSYLGFASTYMPASRLQALPHYQDFINAGWQIGY